MPEGLDHVGRDGSHACLLFGREMSLDVESPEHPAHRLLSRCHRTLRAGAALVWHFGAPKRQGRLGKSARQHLGVRVNGVKAQIVQPRQESDASRPMLRPLHRAWLPDDEGGLLRQPSRCKERGPVQARCLACEVGARPDIVDIVLVSRGLARGVGLRDGRFERHHPFGPSSRIIESRELQHASDVAPGIGCAGPRSRARC